MNILTLTTSGLCLAVAGCTGPLDRVHDDRGTRPASDRYRAPDAGTALGVPATIATAAEQLHALDTLGLDDAIRLAIIANPRLRQAGYEVDIAAGRVTQSGLYPNPSLVFSAEGLGSDAGSGGETIYAIEQEIILGGKLARARDVARVERRIARARLAGEEFALASGVTRAYYAALTAQQRLTHRRDLLELAERLLGSVEAKVDAGASTEPDRLRARLAREQASIEAEAAELVAISALRRLASVIGLDGEITIPLDDGGGVLPVMPERGELLARVLEINSRVEIARLSMERARQAHRLARARGVPDMVASIGSRYSDPDGETTLDLGLGIEIPLFDRNQGEISAALGERLSAGEGLRAVQLELAGEVADAWGEYESARIVVTRYRDQLLPMAARSLELTRQGYERGKGDFLRLLDAQQGVVETGIAYTDALQRLYEAAAMLNELAQLDAHWRTPDAPDATPTQEQP